MKNIIQKIFRYRLSAVFFILGQLIIYVSVFGALNIYNGAYQKEWDRLEYEYDKRIEMSITKMKKSDVLSDSMKNVTCGNAILTGRLSFYFNEKKMSNMVEVIMTQNETMPYVLVEGRLPGSLAEDYGKKQVALGRKQYEYSYEKDGKHYVNFENEEYEVVGIIGNRYSDYQDYKVVFNINCVGENIKKILNDTLVLTIQIGSNESEINETYENIYKNIILHAPGTVIESKSISGNGKSTVEATLYKENFRVNVIVYVFCLLNCMLMSQFWIIQRNKEIAIKRTYGFGIKKIVTEIVRDIVVLELIALLLYLAWHGILCWFNVEIYKIDFNITTIVMVILINIVSIIVTILYPVIVVAKMKPAVKLRDIE